VPANTSGAKKVRINGLLAPPSSSASAEIVTT
jgi:hypothetical protein